MRTLISKLFALMALVVMSNSCIDTKIPSYTEGSEGRLLLGATVHLGDGEVIENAALAVKDGYVTLLADGASKKLDLSKFQVDRLSSEYHIYPFKKTELGNSGIVLARADAKPFNITIRDSEVEKCITIGCEAALLICRGSIKDISKFRVEYVVDGNDKVKILEQSDYKVNGNNNR
ncbi:hypothetical protein [uncultured Roseivirga sp.]|uniref:hypothetical protein n=1 Tax=uncultured Roseivirga sp. TaxID=543088 RepID=UPI0030DB6710|tara:strand:- start:284369 stop:284896 length:528 start_codon:yes stop_codon:yes gene_type:complete